MLYSPLEYHPLITIIENKSSLFSSDLRSVTFLLSLLPKGLESCITNENSLYNL